MNLKRKVNSAPRGSALIAVVFLSMVITIASMAMVSFSNDKRRESARLILYNEELFAAENAMNRLVSQVFFAGINRLPQMTHDTTGGTAGFLTSTVSSISNVGSTTDPFLLEVVAEADPISGNKVIDQAVIDLFPEVGQWRNYQIILDAYTVYAGALAMGNSNLAFSSVDGSKGGLARPGVYMRQTVSFYQVPLLNYAIFYENPFELDGGKRIDVKGKVHTNEDWYLTSSSSVYYHDQATVAGNFYGGIYNPLDGSRRKWWSGKNNINITNAAPSAPGADSNNFSKIYDSKRSLNKGYLSSVDYGAASNGGKPVYNKGGKPEDWWTANPSWVDESLSIFNGFLRDSSHGVKEVQMPIGEFSDPYVIIEPPINSTASGGDAVPENKHKRESKLAYKAAVIFETKNALWTSDDSAQNIDDGIRAYRLVEDDTTATGFREDPYAIQYWPPGTADADKTEANLESFVSHQKIYNGREEKWVHMVDIDMDKMEEYMLSGSTVPTGQTKINLDVAGDPSKSGVMFVNVDQSHVPSGGEHQGGMRIKNASDLKPMLSNAGLTPSKGMTIATNSPMYTKGDLNKGDAGTRIPLMLASDAINILSNSFKDSDYENYDYGTKKSGSRHGPKKGASATETNAVFVTGNVPTMENQYGGGGENFFRYIEGWGKDHLFYGSMLNLFESRVATASWDKNTGSGTSSGYYSPPRRKWSWDSTFGTGTTPPGMPNSYEFGIGRYQILGPTEFKTLAKKDLLNTSWTSK